MTIDTKKLREIAEVAKRRPWVAAIHVPDDDQAALVAAASPQTVISLLDSIDTLQLNLNYSEDQRGYLAEQLAAANAEIERMREQSNAIAAVVGIDTNEPSEQPLLVEVAYHVRNTMESHRRLAHDAVRLTRERDKAREQLAEATNLDERDAEVIRSRSELRRMRAQLAAMTEARDAACEIAEPFLSRALNDARHAGAYGPQDERGYAWDYERKLEAEVARLAELRKVGG